MAEKLEREIKLKFDTAAAARAAVLDAGAVPAVPRRLQHDRLLDTLDGQLRERRSLLRVRSEDERHTLTFKGPVQPSLMKLRSEIETEIERADLMLSILGRLGFRIWFRYEKYREEFTREGVIIAVDETPIGTFVEIEGTEEGVRAAADALGRAAADYMRDSYRSLFVRYCETRGQPVSDMLFERG